MNCEDVSFETLLATNSKRQVVLLQPINTCHDEPVQFHYYHRR